MRAALGTHNHGQGHATSLAQILAPASGVRVNKIEVVEGDTDIVPYGAGTFGSRTIAVGGCVHRAAEKIIAKGTQIAAHLLEAAAGDIEFADGLFTCGTGTDRRASLLPRSRNTAICRTISAGYGGARVADAGGLMTRRASHSATARMSARSR